jgi:hypothetical protein
VIDEYLKLNKRKSYKADAILEKEDHKNMPSFSAFLNGEANLGVVSD